MEHGLLSVSKLNLLIYKRLVINIASLFLFKNLKNYLTPETDIYMIKRLSKEKIELEEFSGQDFLDYFVYDPEYPNEKINEATLEDAVKTILHDISRSISGRKRKAPIRGIPDGEYIVRLNEGEWNIPNFKFIVETKLKLNPGTKEYNEAIKQSILYGIQSNEYKCILTVSLNKIVRIYLDENYNLIEQYKSVLFDSLKEFPPSEGCKHLNFPINNLKMDIIDLPKPAHITKIIKEMIKHCGEL